MFGTLTPQNQYIKPLSWFTGFNASPENRIQDPNGRPQWPPCMSASPPPLKQHTKPLCGHSNLLCEFTEHITLPQNRFQRPKRRPLCRGMLRNVPPALNNTHNQYVVSQNQCLGLRTWVFFDFDEVYASSPQSSL